MNHWTHWLRNAVTPSPKEMSQISQSLPAEVLQVCRDATDPMPHEERSIRVWSQQVDDPTRMATDPLDTEVGRLIEALQHTPQPMPTGPRPILLRGAFLAAFAASLLLLFQVSSTPSTLQSYGTPPVALGLETQLSSHTALVFGPSIRMKATANIVVEQASEAGTIIALNEGSVHFNVDPKGQYRHLRVDAADVQITVKGTIFDVVRLDNVVEVTVTRGSVQVRNDGKVTLVTKGGSWSNRALSMLKQTPPASPSPVPDAGDTTPAHVTNISTSHRPTPPKELPSQRTKSSKQTPNTPDFALNIPEHTKALHDIMSKRESGASLPELTDLVTAYQRQYEEPTSVLKALDILVQFTLEQGDTDASIQVLSDWIQVSSDLDARLARKQHQYRWLRATLYRDKRNNCTKAMEDYLILSDITSEPLRSQSRAWMGLCLTDPSKTMEALRWLSSAQPQHLPTSLGAKVGSRIQKLNATP